MIKNVLIIGATSAIAEAVARRYAEQRVRLFLIARNNEKLKIISSDLVARGAPIAQIHVMDANDGEHISQVLDTVWSAYGEIDVALIAYGTLPDQNRCEIDSSYAISEFQTNAESVIIFLIELAKRFQTQRKGVIAVIGSVAGDRGRMGNYLYGAAKGAIDIFASGLRARLFRIGVHVLTIKPGFVSTPMTAQLDLPARLTASAESVARDIERAISRRINVLYTPWFWSWIMRIIRWMPEYLFKRVRI